VARMEKKRNAYGVLVGKPEGQRQLGRSSITWKDSMKIYLKEMGCEGMDCICLA
jgi:hypothetical protein